MALQSTRIPSPLGEMLLVADAQGAVWSLDFTNDPGRHEVSETGRKITAKIEAYFEGDINALEDIPVANRGSDFQRRVWAALRRIPAGTTTTYGELALSIGFSDPRMAKEVGAAIGANPVAVIVPCHRVIGKDGSLKGYRWGVDRKRALLEQESRGHEASRSFRLASG
jgi:methylated-DNA-[protein]-cysteine S-methyltransferase